MKFKPGDLIIPKDTKNIITCLALIVKTECDQYQVLVLKSAIRMYNKKLMWLENCYIDEGFCVRYEI